jgi:hypothetical protein
MGYPYKGLEKLPGLIRDRYGNLRVAQEANGLRGRIEYALNLATDELAGTRLAELLDWMRWGDECSVMWECTLPELIQVIEKWLAANPEAPWEIFGIHNHQNEVSWDSLWAKQGQKEEIWEAKRCRCGSIHGQFTDCDECGQHWFQMETVSMGPRGPNSYNLGLMYANGVTVAAAVWNYRNWLLIEPQGFRTKPPKLS